MSDTNIPVKTMSFAQQVDMTKPMDIPVMVNQPIVLMQPVGTLEQPTAQVPAQVAPKQLQVIREPEVVTDEFIISLGTQQSNNISNVSKEILSSVKGNDLEQFGSMLGDLIKKTKSIDPKKLSDKGIINKIRHMFTNVKENFMNEYNTVDGQIDRLCVELSAHQKVQEDSIPQYKKLYEENFNEHQMLEKVVDDSKLILESKLASWQATDTSKFDAMEMQKHNDNREVLMRFEKRIHDLTVMMRLAEQNAPEISQGLKNALALVDKLNNIKSLTIPLYRKTFSLAIMNMRQKKCAEIVTAADDATNAALLRNAEMLHQNTVMITKAQQRSVVDIETMEKCAEMTVNTLNEVNTITTAAIAHRKDAEKRMIAANAKILETMKKTK